MRLDLSKNQPFLQKINEVSRFGIVLELAHDGLESGLVIEAEGSVVKSGLLEVLEDEVVELVALDEDGHY